MDKKIYAAKVYCRNIILITVQEVLLPTLE